LQFGAQGRFGETAKGLLALAEVTVVFALVHVTYRSFKHFNELGKQEGAAGLNFSTGSVMILFTVLLLWGCRRSFEEYGLTFKEWPYHLNIGLCWGVLPVIAAAIVVMTTHLEVDPHRGPSPTVALIAAAGSLVYALLLLLMLRRERNVLRRTPPWISLLILLVLLSVPLVVAWRSGRPLGNVFLTVLWLFFGAGFGEEIFFRGYIQSRINSAFGRPIHFLGVDFGLGLLVSSLFFGLIHVLNTVDYFSGRFDFSWWWGLMNVGAGLFFGCMREKTGSILPGAVAHGLSDVLQEIPSLLP
jgi:membrane protease YdiL (CAAX protease family)